MLLKIGLGLFWFIILVFGYSLCVASGNGSRAEEEYINKNN